MRPTACSIAIDVQDFLLDNIDFRPEFKQAIERKQIATQDAETAKNRVREARFKAEQKVEAARGEAQSTLVKATAQAQANVRLSRSITPRIIQYTYAQKLPDTIKTVLLPSDSNLILPPGTVSTAK